jgi:outer membrane receptor protein involved in Fe transport
LLELTPAVKNLFDENYPEWQKELANGRNRLLGVAANFRYRVEKHRPAT